MAGYNHQAGMSNNAVDAHENGIKPLSKITASDLKQAGWTETLRLAKYLAKERFWTKSEYHHTGGSWFNKTNFYDINDLITAWAELNDTDQSIIIEEVKAAKKSGEPGEKVSGTYAEFGGSRRHAKYLGEVKFTGVKIGSWIHLDGGGKKRADGNHISYNFD